MDMRGLSYKSNHNSDYMSRYFHLSSCFSTFSFLVAIYLSILFVRWTMFLNPYIFGTVFPYLHALIYFLPKMNIRLYIGFMFLVPISTSFLSKLSITISFTLQWLKTCCQNNFTRLHSQNKCWRDSISWLQKQHMFVSTIFHLYNLSLV